MTENEKKLFESIVNYEANVKKAQKYIKENYGVDSTFDQESGAMYLICNEAENALNLAAAKEYLDEEYSTDVVAIFD